MGWGGGKSWLPALPWPRPVCPRLRSGVGKRVHLEHTWAAHFPLGRGLGESVQAQAELQASKRALVCLGDTGTLSDVQIQGPIPGTESETGGGAQQSAMAGPAGDSKLEAHWLQLLPLAVFKNHVVTFWN